MVEVKFNQILTKWTAFKGEKKDLMKEEKKKEGNDADIVALFIKAS